jgi:hypothetical protein
VTRSDTLLDDVTHLALFKGLNFAVSLMVLLNEDNLGDVKKAIPTLLVEAAEEVQWETV